jgi:FdhE protein
MPAQTPMTLLPVLQRRVGELCALHPGLEDALALQEVVIRAQLSSPRAPDVQAFVLPRQQVAARVHDGVPLLHDQPVAIDIHFAADLCGRLLHALAPHSQLGDAHVDTRCAVQLTATSSITRGLDAEQLFGEAFVGHADHLAQLASGAGTAADLLVRVATDSVTPILRAYADRLGTLLPQVDADQHWERGYCPVCGRWPLLAEQPGSDTQRRLRCGACGTAWRDWKLACFACCATNARASLALEGQTRFDLEACQRCGTYLKVARALEPTDAELLALDDVASFHLDCLAAEYGYRRPTAAGYRIELSTPDAEWLEELT